MSDYEQKIAQLAREFVAATTDEQDADRRVREHQHEAGRCKSKRIAIEKQLTDCTGRNIPRRFVSLPEGVVEITETAATLHAVILPK